MAASDITSRADAPQQFDLDRCVHCGLCLNACPTYRQLGLEMDSPRGRIFQMVQVAEGLAEITPSYIRHIDLCLACRGCETACPSGVQYGRLVEAARAQIESGRKRPWPESWIRAFAFRWLLPSRNWLRLVGWALAWHQRSGMQELARSTGLVDEFGEFGKAERLSPVVETPFFYSQYGKVFPAEGERRRRVAMLGGCIANVFFARLNEATVRVLTKNGCEVVIPDGQTCCGALHLHSGLAADARALARRNLDAIAAADFDAIITNAGGCGSTLKEYGHLLADDPAYADRAREFAAKVRDVTEFLASMEWNRDFGPLPLRITYQDSCHLAHGQKVRSGPRQLLQSIPGIEFREMALAEQCCGSAGIYNLLEPEMSAAVLKAKMRNVQETAAQAIVTANPGCILQLRAGVERHGRGQRVAHVVEILDEAYRAKASRGS
ncbi:MAG: 4Fe-4S dicluster domain-containing protein [Acidobacteria bacterium]|nr:4Fe-4S dicluster domain-containing protein [Acidobacteriota bacterium]